MQLLKTKRNITIVYIAVILFIVAMLFFFYRNMVKMRAENDTIITSIDRLDKIQQILINIEALENTQRGFIISGNQEAENKYIHAEKSLITNIITVENELKSDADIFNDFKLVKDKINKHLNLGKTICLLRKSEGAEAAIRFSKENKSEETIHDIRTEILNIEKKDWRKLDESGRNNEKLSQKRIGQLILLALTFITLLGLSYINLSRDFNLKKAKEKILKFNASIVESISDAVIITDVNYNITAWNKYAEEIFGYTPAEAIGNNIIDFLKVSSQNIPLDEILQAFTNNGEWKGQLINYGNGNKIVYVDVVCSIIKDETGNVIGGVNIIRNITDRVINEQKLKELTHYLENEVNVKIEELNLSNNRFNLLSKATNDALWDWNIKEQKVWGNESFYNMTGMAQGSPIEINDFNSMLTEEDREKIKTSIEEAAKTKSIYTSVEYKLKNKHQKIINVLSRSYIVYDKLGNAIRMLGSMQDITLRKKIQDQILIEKELSDTVINSLPGIFYMFNDDFRFVRWNKNIEKITGYLPEEMEKINPVDFVPDEQKEIVSEKIANVFRVGEDNVEADLLTKDNKRIPYFFTGMSIHYNGQLCMMGVGIDISEKKKSQEELRRLTTYLQNIREEERGRIAREIHDDLGQQLTGLKMEMSWVLKKINPDEAELKEKVRESVQLIDETVQSVRRIATQLRPSILDDLGLVAALEWLSEEYEKRYHIRTLFSSKNILNHIHPDTAIALFRIYQESLTNILRHSKATEVNASLSFESNQIVLLIVDNGIGFEIEKVSASNTLGLIGIKERVHLMGGSLKIESKKGEGASLLVSVPNKT